jgi:hypothetical protein
MGAFHGNLPHVANIDNQRNSTNLQVSVAVQHNFHSNAYVQQYRLHRCFDTATVNTWLTANSHVTRHGLFLHNPKAI